MAEIEDFMEWGIEPALLEYVRKVMTKFPEENVESPEQEIYEYITTMVDAGVADLLWNSASQKKWWALTPAFYGLIVPGEAQQGAEEARTGRDAPKPN